jgi:hypothetical protein
MRNLYLVAVAATVWLGACTTDSGFTIKCTVNGETKEFTTSPGRDDCDKIRANPTAAAPATTTPAATVPAKEAPIFANPVVSQPTAGFLEPTNRSQRQEEISSRLAGAQRDPFAIIPGSEPAPVAPSVPFTPRPPRLNSVSIKPVEPPSTVEASAVLVSGIMEIGGNKFAIINAPGEPTSRSVAVGQTFVSGKVLFKRVDNISGAAFVILEQNGVEVTRPVGKQTISAEVPKPL